MKIISWFWGLKKITKPLNIFFAATTQFFIYIKIYPEERSDFIAFFPVTLSMAFVMGAGYLINAYYDVKIDLVNKPQKVVIGRYLSRRMVMIFHAIYCFFGIAIGFWADLKIGILNVILLFFLWLYSNWLKRIPIWGNLTLALLSTSIIWSVCIYTMVFSQAILIYSVFVVFIETIRHLLKDILDFKGDKIHRINSLPVKVGLPNTKKVIFSLSLVGYLLSIVYILMAKNAIQFYIFLLIGLILLLFWYRLWLADRRKHFKQLINICKAVIFVGVISIFIS